MSGTDAYQEYIEQRRRQEAEKPERAPDDILTVELRRDEVNGLLSLFDNHYKSYKTEAQILLARAASKLEKSLLADS